MRKKLFIGIGFILAFILVWPSGCRKKEDKVPSAPEAPPLGELNVAYVSPQGATSAPHESETVVVIFDRAMVPLEAISGGSEPAFIKFKPAIDGKYRWLNPRTLTFTPKKPFPYATEITATILPGLRSLDNHALAQDYSWTFRTITPRLVQHFPRDKQKWLKVDTRVVLVFNQDISKNQARDFISLKGFNPEGVESVLDFTLETPTEKLLEENEIKAQPDKILLLDPSQDLSLDYAYAVELKAGLSGREGALGMEKDRRFQFETVKSFLFEALVVSEEHNPYDPLKFRFTNPVVYKEFVQRIRFEPEIQIPDYYSEWGQSNSILWISLPLEPETAYTLWIDPELEDMFGNKLGKEINLAFSTARYSPSVSMNTEHGILEAYADLRYPLYVVNVDKVSFQAARIGKHEVIPLLNQQNLFWSKERFSREAFWDVEESLKLEIARNKREIYPLNLRERFPQKHGTIFLQLDTFLEDKRSRYPKALLQVTELGISAKFSPENSLIWVTELKTGKPVPDASVEIRNDANKVLWRGKTDNQGAVTAEGWRGLKLKSRDKWSRPLQWIFVSKDDDFAFISSEWETGIYPYRFGISYDWNPKPVTLQGYIYSDRGIYRAGETVHIKGIIRKREKGELKTIGVKSVDCEVEDPFRKSVYKGRIELDEYSSFTLDLETSEEASLGNYQVKAEVPPESKEDLATALYSSFRVEAFRPAEFEVILRSSEENYVFGDNYEAEVMANYLFGGALASQQVSWYLRLNPAYFTPAGNDGYVFGSQIDRWERYDREDSLLLSSGESTLDEQGKIKITAKLKPEKEVNSVYAALEAAVQGPSRRAISSRIQTIIHRGEYYIGLQPSTTFLSKGEDIHVNIITVKPDGSMDPEKNIQIKLLQREWNSVRKSEIGGRFRWISEKKDTEIESLRVETKNEAVQVTFTPEKAGLYILKAEGKDRRGNTITTTTYFYLTGRDYIPWERSDEDVVELVSDSENYSPGDVAKILVKSPYEKANALITIEREFVLGSRVVEIVGSTGEIEIPIESDHIPNVFVSVLLVQGRTAPRVEDENEDLGKPSFKIGYIQLNVDPSEKRLTIDIQKQKSTYRPGDEITLDLKVKDWKEQPTEASVSLAVVDVGVLNLIGFKTPDPFSEFYSRKPLAVSTSDSRPYVIGQLAFGEKGEDVGGGAGEQMLASKDRSLAEIELRGDFRFTAYWNPGIITSQDGQATVTFRLPDNLTTFRIMAVAQTLDSRFGRSESNFRVTKPLLLKAALPRFARVGDEFQGGLVVHNQTQGKRQVTVDCKAQGIVMIEEDGIREISLNPGEAKEVLYGFRVENTGMATFEFRALMDEDTDGLRTSIPLQMPRMTETVALFNSTQESVEEKIRIPEDVYPALSRIDFMAAASALAGLEGSVDYLTNYPYLCLEQRLSSLLPFIVARDVILDFKLSQFDAEKMKEYVDKSLKEVYKHQKGSGGFGLWSDSPYDSPYISCYAAFALAKARDAGHSIDQQSVINLIEYLKNMLRSRIGSQHYPYGERVWKTTTAFALYALALWNQPEPSYAENLFSEKETLSLTAKTLLLKALKQGKGSINAQNVLIQELMNKIKVSPTTAHFEDDEGRQGGWIYSSNNRTTSLILQSLLEAGSDSPLVPSIARWLVERRKAGSWHTTQENFYVFYALNDFYRKYENVSADFNVKVSMARKEILNQMFKERTRVEKARLSLAEFEPGKTIPLEVKMKGEGTLYYQTRLTYAPNSRLPARDEGFFITKKITSLDGKPLDTVKAGSLVVVTLEVTLPKESLFVVLNDPLPAGLEAVNPVFMTESEEDQRSLEQMEETRRQWWQGFNHVEMHDNRVLLFADSLTPGIHTHRYLARALTFGTFNAPGTKIEEMYGPEIFGRTGELTLKITQ